MINIIKSYKAELFAVILLILLAYIAVAHDKIFEFLIVIFSWIQIEVSYRLWWYELRSRKPHLIPRFSVTQITTNNTVSDISVTIYVKNVGLTPAYDVQLWLEADSVKEHVKEITVISQGEEKELGRIDKKLLDSILQRLGTASIDIKIVLYYYDPVGGKTERREIASLSPLRGFAIIITVPKHPGVLLNVPLLARAVYEDIRKAFRRSTQNRI